MPALLTSTSTPPSRPATASTGSRSERSSVTSAVTAVSGSAGEGSRSRQATAAPRAASIRAVASPMPEPPPVTIAPSPDSSSVTCPAPPYPPPTRARRDRDGPILHGPAHGHKVEPRQVLDRLAHGQAARRSSCSWEPFPAGGRREGREGMDATTCRGRHQMRVRWWRLLVVPISGLLLVAGCSGGAGREAATTAETLPLPPAMSPAPSVPAPGTLLGMIMSDASTSTSVALARLDPLRLRPLPGPRL